MLKHNDVIVTIVPDEIISGNILTKAGEYPQTNPPLDLFQEGSKDKT